MNAYSLSWRWKASRWIPDCKIMNSITDAINETKASLSSISEAADHWFDKEEQLRAYKPVNGGWNINEVLEHIVLTNHYLLILIRKGMKKALKAAEEGTGSIPADYQLHTKELEEVGKHGSFKWIRPEHMEPKGERSLDDVRKEFHEQLQECHAALDAMPNGEGTLYKQQ